MNELSLDELSIELPEGAWSGGEVDVPKLPGLEGASYVAKAYEYLDERGGRVWVHVGPALDAPSGEDEERARVSERMELEWARIEDELGEGTEIDEAGPSFFPGEVYVGHCVGLHEGGKMAIVTSAMSAEALEATVSVVFLLRYEYDEEIPGLVEAAGEAIDSIALGPA